MKEFIAIWWLIRLALKTPGSKWRSDFHWPLLRRFQPEDLPIRLERWPKDLAFGVGLDVPVALELHFLNLPDVVLKCTVSEDGADLLEGDKRPMKVLQHILRECDKEGVTIPWQGDGVIYAQDSGS